MTYEETPFAGELVTVKVMTDSVCYGPKPDPEDVVAQRFTISKTGQLKIVYYKFADGYKYDLADGYGYTLDENENELLKRAFAKCFSKPGVGDFVTDVGTWEVVLTNDSGDKYRYHGSLFAIGEDLAELEEEIRSIVPDNDLWLFSGPNYMPDINRIELEYRDHSEVTPDVVPEGASWDKAIIEFEERYSIDRETETVRFERQLSPQCKWSSEYQIEGGVESFLDGLDAEALVADPKGNTEDVILDPCNSETYRLKVDFEDGTSKTLQGTFDRNCLPEGYGEFAEELSEFMEFYAGSAALSPRRYKQVHRRPGEYYYCSVVFEDFGKQYYYKTKNEGYGIGDIVSVPAGEDDEPTFARIESIECFDADNAPLPPDKTKDVLGKLEPDE